MRSEAESKSIFISVVYDSLQFPRFSLRPPEPLWASKLGPISPLQFGIGLALWRRLSAESASSGVWTNVVWNLQRGIVERGKPAALKVRPRCVAGFDPLLQIQTVGARSAPGRGCAAAGICCWRLGSRAVSGCIGPPPHLPPPSLSDSASLLRGCWVSTEELARLHLRLG